ncbi:MAG: hypothetical protein HY291_21675 [Planctomycetes bacterium]|nr:hypothetical protein [Planctomycetota bacterium]
MADPLYLDLGIPLGAALEKTLIPKMNQFAAEIEAGLKVVLGERVLTKIDLPAVKRTKPKDIRFPYLSITSVVRIREGFRRGVDIEILWVDDETGRVAVTIKPASKLSKMPDIIFWAVTLPFILAGFLFSLSGILWAKLILFTTVVFMLAGMVVGRILAVLLSLVLGSCTAERENAALAEEVHKWIAEHFKHAASGQS